MNIVCFLLISVATYGASLDVLWETRLGPLNGHNPVRPAPCPDGTILAVVAGERYSWLSEDGKVLFRGGPVFDDATLFVVCQSKIVAAFGSGFVRHFERRGFELVKQSEIRFPLVLRSAHYTGQEWIAIAGSKQSINIVRGLTGSVPNVILRSQPVSLVDSEKHRNGLLDGAVTRCNSNSSDFYLMSPRSLQIEKLATSSGQQTGSSSLPYPRVLDIMEGSVYRQGDSFYGLGCVEQGKVVTQLVRRSMRKPQVQNLLILLDEDLRNFQEVDLSEKITGLFVTSLPGNRLLFSGHTVSDGEKLRLFQLTR